ncbi:MAG TPA: ABC transporter ATP-binding protein [Ktedonobacterales bacterium]
MLELKGIDTFYGPSHVLQNVSVQVNQGEIVCLLGANAAGKTTTMKTIFGIVRPVRGAITFEGRQIERASTSRIVASGLAMVPEGRHIFPQMTVLENLEMGAFLHSDRKQIQEDMERVFVLFPRMKERLKQAGGTLSGGEQQMLAMGRALMARPRLLCMDEPSMGLAPNLVEQVFDIIQEVRKQGVTIFLVEQNANMALNVADRGYVLQNGKIVLGDTAPNLLTNDLVRQAYLGGG